MFGRAICLNFENMWLIQKHEIELKKTTTIKVKSIKNVKNTKWKYNNKNDTNNINNNENNENNDDQNLLLYKNLKLVKKEFSSESNTFLLNRGKT